MFTDDLTSSTADSASKIAGSCLPLTTFTDSRGSSWHRWPISRLTHLVQGRSCTIPADQLVATASGARARIRWRILTHSQVICCHWRGSIMAISLSVHTSAKVKKGGRCRVAEGEGKWWKSSGSSPSAGSRHKLRFCMYVSAHDSDMSNYINQETKHPGPHLPFMTLRRFFGLVFSVCGLTAG